MESSTDLLALIAQRAQMIQLIADGNKSKRSITTMLPVSRSTVTRALKALTDAQLVHQAKDGYALTLQGQLAYQAFQEVTDYYETLIAAKQLLQYLPATASINRSLFEGATVYHADCTNPDAPRIRFEDLVRRSEDIVGIYPIISQRTLDIYLDQLSNRTLHLSLLLDATASEHLQQESPDKIHTASQAEHCTLYVCPQTPPFSLVIVDQTELWFGVYDDQGHLKGGLQNASHTAITWAEQCLQQYSNQGYQINSQP